METQIVQGYTRYKQVDDTPKKTDTDQTPAIILAGGTLILCAIVFWQVGLTVGLLGFAGIAVKHLAPIRAIKEIQALRRPVDAPKPKRHYQHRIKVNHYQGKTVRI